MVYQPDSTLTATLLSISDQLGFDVEKDLVTSDDPAMYLFDRAAFQAVSMPAPDPRMCTTRVASMALQFFIMGREHAMRGHTGPTFRTFESGEEPRHHVSAWFGMIPIEDDVYEELDPD